MSNCNQCGQCSQCAPVVQLTPPPICPTNACEEYISSDCVNNEVTAACSSVFTDPQTGEQTAVGYNISSGSTMTEVISALTSPQNCLFSENYLGAALQYIGNSTLLTSILCGVIQDCIDGCPLFPVTTLSFEPVVVTDDGTSEDAYWTTNFFAHLGSNNLPDYSYTITITDTSTNPANVWERTLTPAQLLAIMETTPGPNYGLVHFNFNLSGYALTLVDGTGPATTNLLPSGHTYETVITAEYLGIECPSDSFTLVVPESPLCGDCTYDLAFTECEVIPEGNICLDITAEQGGLPSSPYAYQIVVTNDTTSLVVSDAFYLTDGDNPFNFVLTDLTGTDYTVEVTPVCSFEPIYCSGEPTTYNVTVDPPAACAAPDITNVTVTP